MYYDMSNNYTANRRKDKREIPRSGQETVWLGVAGDLPASGHAGKRRAGGCGRAGAPDWSETGVFSLSVLDVAGGLSPLLLGVPLVLPALRVALLIRCAAILFGVARA